MQTYRVPPKALQQTGAVTTATRKAATWLTFQKNVTANGDRPAVEGKLKAVIERYFNGQHAVLCPWGLLDYYRAGRQMTLKVSMDPSISSRAKSPCPVSLTTPHGGPIMCPIWLLCGGDACSIYKNHCLLYFYHPYTAYAHIYICVYFSIQYIPWYTNVLHSRRTAFFTLFKSLYF